MGLIPDTKPGKIAFFNAKVTPWTANAVAIGTTTEAITDFTAKLTAASDKLDAQVAAQEVARAATAAADVAIAALVGSGMDIIKQVRIKASTAGPDVYELAQIPAPANPSPRPAPGEPTSFKVALANNGALTLKWKCPNPAGSTGTTYQVWRRLAASGDLTFLGVTGLKNFVDATIPAGTTQATYQIQAFRSTMAGPWAQFNVNFTTDVGGTVTAAATGTTMRAAA